MDRFFSFLSRNKSVFSFKNRSRTGKTEDFSSPGSCHTYDNFVSKPRIFFAPNTTNHVFDTSSVIGQLERLYVTVHRQFIRAAKLLVDR